MGNVMAFRKQPVLESVASPTVEVDAPLDSSSAPELEGLPTAQEPEAMEGEGRFFPRLAFYADHLLRNREELYDRISDRRSIGALCLVMVTMAVLGAGSYGFTMGAFGGVKQALASAVKAPLLLALPLTIAIPALYAFNTLLGSGTRLSQIAAVACMAQATTAILLVALAPLSIFFLFTGVSYSFLKVLHVTLFFVAGYFGAFVLYVGLQTVSGRMGKVQNLPLLQIWLCLYAYIGAQMSWILRPFLGDPHRPFALFRSIESSFFKGLADALTTLFK